MGRTDEKLAPRRCSSRRWRKREAGHKRKQELLVVDAEYRAPRRSYGLWEKKIKALRNSEKELIRKKREAAYKARAEFWRKVWETDGFDMDHLKDSHRWLMFPCNGKDCPLLVRHYAKVGLHRHNILEGTNLQLRGIEKYNRFAFCMPRAEYYITLLAEDPATASLVTFQTSVYERSPCTLNLSCVIARPKPTGTKSTLMADNFYDNKGWREWPTNKAFLDENRFLYKVQESEWEKNDWIRQYLELAFVTTNRRNHNPNLSDLKISNVVVETEENLPYETVLKCFRNATVYISYDHDLGEDGVCKRRAMVRRTVDLISKRYCLVGKTLPVPDFE